MGEENGQNFKTYLDVEDKGGGGVRNASWFSGWAIEQIVAYLLSYIKQGRNWFEIEDMFNSMCLWDVSGHIHSEG